MAVKTNAQRRIWPTSLVAMLAALAALLASSLVLAPRAEAFVYWTNSATPPCKTGQGCTGPAAIGRANLDAIGVAQQSIELGTPATGVAVDGEHIYWSASACKYGPDPCTTGAIGRAELDGTGVDESFVATGSYVGGLAVDANHVYWSDQNGIARAKLDGTGVEPDFITTIQAPAGVAVDAAHIYWAESQPFPAPTGTVGRANLDGSQINHNFLVLTQGTLANALAVDASHIYWTAGAFTAAWISRAHLDGSFDLGFRVDTHPPGIPGANGVAVDSLTDTQLFGSAGAAKIQKQHGNAIVVEVEVSAGERLTATARGKVKVNPRYKLKPKEAVLGAGESVTLRLKPKKQQARKIAAALRQGERAVAKLKVKLSDLAANSETVKLRVRLRPG